MRAPTASETLMSGVHPYSQFFNLRFLPNPFLVPEEQKGWEFGFNVMKDGLLAPKDKLRIKADYYRQDVQNYITSCLGPSGYDPVAMVAYSTAYFCNNFGTTDLHGVEVEADYDIKYAFAHAAYTYTQSNLPQQQNGLGAESYMPDHVFSITGGLRFLDEKLEVGMRGTFVSKTDLGSGNFNDAYQIADFFSTGPALTFGFLTGNASLAEDLTSTLGWAVFAIVLLSAGIALRNRPARVAAILLLVAAALKGFLHDLASLGGLYRVGSFVGLAVSLALVAVLLQKFVLRSRDAPDTRPDPPAGPSPAEEGKDGEGQPEKPAEGGPVTLPGEPVE